MSFKAAGEVFEERGEPTRRRWVGWHCRAVCGCTHEGIRRKDSDTQA